MASIINASTSSGIVTTADTSGILKLQTAGTDAVTVSASQVVTLANPLPAASGGTGNTGGAWTTYTPTISAATGTITTSSATGSYQAIGKTCFFTMNITITTAGTGANQLFATLPFTSAARVQTGAFGGEFNSTGYMVKGYIPTSTSQLQLTYYNNSTVIASGNSVIVSGFYETA